MSPERKNPRNQGRGPRRTQRQRPPVRNTPPRDAIEPSTPTRVGVASVRRPWGTEGAIAVSPFSDEADRFSPGDTVYLRGGREARVIECHRAGSATVLQLDVVRNARDAGALRGTIIEMEGADLPEAPEGAYYHYEIIGMKVRTTGGEELGEVIEIIVTGANDVYVVGKPGSARSSGSPEYKSQVLIPAIADVVLDVDINNGVVTVNLPEGLR